MKKLRVAVLGAGHLGNYHLAKLAADVRVELVAAVDPEAGRRADAEARHRVPTTDDAASLVGKVDAVVIAAPTSAHFAVAKQALERGWHVLVEKPITTTVEEGQVLVDLAAQKGVVLQVGHTERFNPAVAAALAIADRPRYIITERLGPFTGRSTDVDVVLDLMIHDLDIVASMIPAEVTEVRAIGVPVLTQNVDMANVRLEFADGSVAQLAAGRASLEPSRKIRMFTVERYLSIDCVAREVKSVRRLPPEPGSNWPQIVGEPVDVPAGDPLALQDGDFVRCVMEGDKPRVDGKAGLRALALAAAVKREMRVPLG